MSQQAKDILQEIILHKQQEVAQQKEVIPMERLQKLVQEMGTAPKRSMKAALATSSAGIIAEFKRRSPSKGWIHQGADASVIPAAYETAGASALSILTDEHFFGGSLNDLQTARPLVNIPILRKEFIIDPYQLWQAKLAGADAVLLIAACLSLEHCKNLADEAHALGLEVLLEIHSTDELPYIYKGIEMVGVNNRHLGSFVTDVQNSYQIADSLKQTVKERMDDVVLVSESGIAQPQTIRELRQAGFRGFLMGETFMKTEQPAATLQQFIANL